MDDEDIVRRTALERHGYSVLLANNGLEAVELLRERASQISLVLLDFTMPVMDGVEALSLIQEVAAEVPVVLSRGYDEVEATRRFTTKCLAGFIQKPYTSAQLIRKFAEILKTPAPPAPG